MSELIIILLICLASVVSFIIGYLFVYTSYDEIISNYIKREQELIAIYEQRIELARSGRF